MGECVVTLLVGGFFFGILELYLWYNHITYVSNDCGRGTRSCVLYVSLLYYYHSHFGVVVGMMMRCFPVSSYVCVNLFYVCIVFSTVAMSFSRSYSITDIWMCGIIVDGGMNLGSLVCMGARCVCTMLL